MTASLLIEGDYVQRKHLHLRCHLPGGWETAVQVWGMRQGARDYVTKPVNPEELISKIRALG